MLYKEQKVTKRDFKGNDNYKFKFPKSTKIICARYFCVQRANGKYCMAVGTVFLITCNCKNMIQNSLEMEIVAFKCERAQ